MCLCAWVLYIFRVVWFSSRAKVKEDFHIGSRRGEVMHCIVQDDNGHCTASNMCSHEIGNNQPVSEEVPAVAEVRHVREMQNEGN